MVQLKVTTEGGASENGKKKVFFTAHPAELEDWLNPVADILFRMSDCAIYSVQDPKDEIDEADAELLLNGMHIIVIAVSFRLLTEDCGVADIVRYAQRMNIPLLLILVEPGLEAVYIRNELLEKLQVIDLCDEDDRKREASLKSMYDRLDRVLSDKNIRPRIHEAFDARTFLSYRKKDRKEADALMRLIHSDVASAGIAIWFDGYLIPGERFDEGIRNAIDESDVFLLLVTPSVLELNEEGKTNYVVAEEYPYATETMKKTIFPVEAKPVRQEELAEAFPGIKECIPVGNEEHLRDTLWETLSAVGREKRDRNPEQQFLLGSAYVEGIEVETDASLGLRLLEQSADAEYWEALKKLSGMYSSGFRVQRDLSRAMTYARRCVEACSVCFGDQDSHTWSAKERLAYALREIGGTENGDEAKRLLKTVYDARLEKSGPEDAETVRTGVHLATAMVEMGEYDEAAELLESFLTGDVQDVTKEEIAKAYISYLGVLHYKGETLKALYLIKESWMSKIIHSFGGKSPSTANLLNTVAVMMASIGAVSGALEIINDALTVVEEDPDKLSLRLLLQSSRAKFEMQMWDYGSAISHQEEILKECIEHFGPDHMRTLNARNNLGFYYGENGEYQKALDILTEVYEKRCKILTPDHPYTLNTRNNIANMLTRLERYEEAEQIYRDVLEARKRVLGEQHPDVLQIQNNLAYLFRTRNDPERKDRKNAIDLYQKTLEQRKAVSGEYDPETLLVMKGLARAYVGVDNRKAVRISKAYAEEYKKGFGDTETACIAATLDHIEFCLVIEMFGPALEKSRDVWERVTADQKIAESLWERSFTTYLYSSVLFKSWKEVADLCRSVLQKKHLEEFNLVTRLLISSILQADTQENKAVVWNMIWKVTRLL